jgi:hypothetical protein
MSQRQFKQPALPPPVYRRLEIADAAKVSYSIAIGCAPIAAGEEASEYRHHTGETPVLQMLAGAN